MPKVSIFTLPYQNVHLSLPIGSYPGLLPILPLLLPSATIQGRASIMLYKGLFYKR